MIIWLGITVALLVIGAYAAIIGTRFLRYRRVSKGILSDRVVKDITPEHADGHILIVGDSTMYSAGVSDTAYTIGGLFASLYPDSSVETRAANGARCRDVPSQLASGIYEQYDIIMIGIGGNDVVRLTPSGQLRRDLTRLLEAAARKAGRVIVCTSVNVGNVGFFPFPLNYLYDARSRHFARLCQDITQDMRNVQFVNFYRPLHDDHYDKRSRHKFVAADGFHANEFANKYFFEIIVKEAKLTPPSRRADGS